MLTSTDSVDNGSDSDIVNISHSQRPPQFEFTFQGPCLQNSEMSVIPAGPSSPITCHLKWSGHYADGPSSLDSPQQKCLKVSTSSLSSQLSPSPSPPQTPMEGNSPSYNVLAVIDSDCSGNQKGTLFQYWAWESTEKQAERVQQEFEELKDAWEMSKLADEHREVERKNWEQAQVWECQQRHRERLCNIKIVSGWKLDKSEWVTSLFNYDHWSDHLN